MRKQVTNACSQFAYFLNQVGHRMHYGLALWLNKYLIIRLLSHVCTWSIYVFWAWGPIWVHFTICFQEHAFIRFRFIIERWEFFDSFTALVIVCCLICHSKSIQGFSIHNMTNAFLYQFDTKSKAFQTPFTSEQCQNKMVHKVHT